MAEYHADSEDLGFSVLEVEVAVVLFVEVAEHQFVDLVHDKAGVGELPHAVLIEEKQHEHAGRLGEVDLHLH